MGNTKEKPRTGTTPAAGGKQDAVAGGKDRSKDALKGQSYEDQVNQLGGVPEAEGVPEEGEQDAAGKQEAFETALKAQYERQFGATYGPKIYDLLTNAIGPDKLKGYAKSALEGALKKVPDFVNDATAKKQLEEAWGPASKQIAESLVNTPALQSVLAGLSNFSRENPIGLATVALITAVLVGIKLYADNIDIPALEGMVKLTDNVKIGGKVDLGKVQNITVDSLHAYLDVHTSKFAMKLDAGHDVERKEGQPDKGTASLKLDGSATLYEAGGKDVDPQTQLLKREWATKLSSTFGGEFKFNESEWNLESMQLAYGIALEARDKKLVSSSKLDLLERNEYRESVFKLYGNVLSKYKNVDGALQPSELSMALGLSLVMKQTVEIKSTAADGTIKNLNLTPLSYGFNAGMTYNEKMFGEQSKNLGVTGGAFIEKGNWSLGASVDYTKDMMSGRDSIGGKVTFSIKF